MGNDRLAMPAETLAELRSTLMYKCVRLTEGRRGRERYYVHLVPERPRMAIMLTLQCPVPVHSRVDILPCTWGTAWVVDLYVSIVAKCYNVFVLILMQSTVCIRYVNMLHLPLFEK